jgi:hypothetical protein
MRHTLEYMRHYLLRRNSIAPITLLVSLAISFLHTIFLQSENGLAYEYREYIYDYFELESTVGAEFS